jgi:hypothetical protein
LKSFSAHLDQLGVILSGLAQLPLCLFYYELGIVNPLLIEEAKKEGSEDSQCPSFDGILPLDIRINHVQDRVVILILGSTTHKDLLYQLQLIVDLKLPTGSLPLFE